MKSSSLFRILRTIPLSKVSRKRVSKVTKKLYKQTVNKQKESLRNVFRHKKGGNSRNALFTMCADVCETWRYAFIMMSELRLRPLDAMKGKIVVFVAATRACPRPHSAVRHLAACRWRTLFLERGASNDRNVGRLASLSTAGIFPPPPRSE